MAGIEDLNIPNDPNILGDLPFTPEPNVFALLENNLLQGVPLLDAMKQVGIDKALNLSGLDVGLQNDIKNNLPTDQVAANFALPGILDSLPVPYIIKKVLLTGIKPTYNMSTFMPVGESGQFGVNAALGVDPSLTLGYDYQPNKDTFFNAGIVYGEGKPKIGIDFKHNFAQGGAVTDIDIFS